MAQHLVIHPDQGHLEMGPVQPRGDHRLRELMERVEQQLVAMNLFQGSVTLGNPAPRTYRIDAVWATETGRAAFAMACTAAIHAVEYDPNIEWAGP